MFYVLVKQFWSGLSVKSIAAVRLMACGLRVVKTGCQPAAADWMFPNSMSFPADEPIASD